ncbi:MAG: hypothetical protein Fur0022_21950 [Anaerolineales bacterium]
MMPSLRPARAEDAQTIHDLVWKAKINPSGLKWERFIVAVSPEGEVIGCGQIKPHADGTQELASIVIAPAWQGKGLARAIIEHLIASHPGELYLMCLAGLRPLYEKFGFRVLAEDEMPPYIRRLKRLTKIAEVVMQQGEILLAMKREESAL